MVVGDGGAVVEGGAAGMDIEQLADPSAPVTVVCTFTCVIPGPSLRVAVPEKVPSAAVVVVIVTLAPMLLVAVMLVGRLAVGGVT